MEYANHYSLRDTDTAAPEKEDFGLPNTAGLLSPRCSKDTTAAEGKPNPNSLAAPQSTSSLLASTAYQSKPQQHENGPFQGQTTNLLLLDHETPNGPFQGHHPTHFKILQRLVSQASVWSLTAENDDEFTLEHEALAKNEILVYLIHQEIRKRCSNLWTESSFNKIIVKKLEEEEVDKLLAESGDSLERHVVDYFVGFTKIIKLLVSLKKPIVGHNLLIDLMILYNQFIEPLPDDYKTFKENINSLFPKIFDTKYISYELRKVIKREDCWNSNAVLELYRYFSEGRGLKSTLYRPVVKIWTHHVEQLNPDILLHEAGWDSYICGYCFIQMGHHFACINYGLNGYERPLSSIEHINGVSNFVNKVNIVRASIGYVNLSGDDPPTNRPKTLLVKLKSGSSIDTTEITGILAKYCSIDIKALNNKNALVAVSNYNSARQILKDFQNHKKYLIKVYHPVRDSELIRAALWSGLIISGGVCITALVMKLFERGQ